jgi:hypothetical protein
MRIISTSLYFYRSVNFLNLFARILSFWVYGTYSFRTIIIIMFFLMLLSASCFLFDLLFFVKILKLLIYPLVFDPKICILFLDFPVLSPNLISLRLACIKSLFYLVTFNIVRVNAVSILDIFLISFFRNFLYLFNEFGLVVFAFINYIFIFLGLLLSILFNTLYKLLWFL